MTILFYAPLEVFRQPTGLGIYVSRLLKALLEIDHRHSYIVWLGCVVKATAIPLPFKVRGKVVITRLPTRLFHHPYFRTFLWWLGHLPLADWLFEHPQVFFSPFYPFLPYRWGALVLTIFDLTPLTLPECHLPTTRWTSRLTLLWAKRAQRVLTFSEAVKGELIQLLNFDPCRITVTPLAADEGFQPQSPLQVEAVKQRYGLTAPYLLYVGTIEPRKNLVTLLRAFAPLTKEFPHLLVLARAKGWMSEPVFAEINERGLQNRVRLLGYVPLEDLPALMSGADVFVYPSLREGFGLPPLEAMACGAPVVCSDAPALPEVVGDAAITVPPLDKEAWTEVLRKVLKQADLRQEMRQKGLARAKQFSWERTARLTLEAFEQVAREK